MRAWKHWFIEGEWALRRRSGWRLVGWRQGGPVGRRRSPVSKSAWLALLLTSGIDIFDVIGRLLEFFYIYINGHINRHLAFILVVTYCLQTIQMIKINHGIITIVKPESLWPKCQLCVPSRYRHATAVYYFKNFSS